MRQTAIEGAISKVPDMKNSPVLTQPSNGATFAYPFPCSARPNSAVETKGPTIFKRMQSAPKTGADPIERSTWWTSADAPA